MLRGPATNALPVEPEPRASPLAAQRVFPARFQLIVQKPAGEGRVEHQRAKTAFVILLLVALDGRFSVL